MKKERFEDRMSLTSLFVKKKGEESMKRVVMMILVIIISVLVGCGREVNNRPENVREEVYRHGVNVVEVVDEYLNDEASWEEVSAKMFNGEVEYESVEEKEIEKAIQNTWEGMFLNYGDSDELLVMRNSLAELLNVEERE